MSDEPSLGSCGCQLGPTGMTEPADYAAYRAFWRDHRCPKSLIAVDPPAEPASGSIDFDIGYATALKDVLAQIVIAGKQNLVQWLEKKLKDLP